MLIAVYLNCVPSGLIVQDMFLLCGPVQDFDRINEMKILNYLYFVSTGTLLAEHSSQFYIVILIAVVAPMVAAIGFAVFICFGLEE